MKILLSLLLSATLASVFAESTTDSAAANQALPIYINLNTGIAKLYNMPTGEWTGNINAGYNFNPYFALEGGYNLFAGSEYGVTTTTNIFDVAAKGTLPLSDIFSLYGRAGVGFGMNGWSGTINYASNCILCNNSINSNYGLGLLGLGVSFSFSKYIDLRVEDTAYIPFSNTTTGTINAVTGGVQYNF
jgi:hypothetical protein